MALEFGGGADLDDVVRENASDVRAAGAAEGECVGLADSLTEAQARACRAGEPSVLERVNGLDLVRSTEVVGDREPIRGEAPVDERLGKRSRARRCGLRC